MVIAICVCFCRREGDGKTLAALKAKRAAAKEARSKVTISFNHRGLHLIYSNMLSVFIVKKDFHLMQFQYYYMYQLPVPKRK